jgi:hypothetical protein
LRGAYEESQENWDEAAVIYFDGLRVGRHMTHQRTLLEAIAGMQIQENNFFALARWAARCPEPGLVARAFGLFESMSHGLTDPARTLASETAILALEFDQIKKTFPNGPWGEIILESLGVTPIDDEQENRKQAVAACAKLGVPRTIFQDVKSFRRHVDRLAKLETRFAEAAAAAMQLPPKARIERGQRLYERYTKAVGIIGERGILNPAEIGALFAEHEAMATVLRCSLAVAARRSDRGFPDELADIAGGFGGTVPTSPYDGSAPRYEVRGDGKAFRIAVKEVRVNNVTLPRVDFNSAPPVAVPK